MLPFIATLSTRYKPASTMRCTPGDYDHHWNPSDESERT